ncbi:MAG: hypothetical protein KME17_18570 [Cyanosarcina radialis HA8281-LM2]|jgi:hypothetical protein|nr:hypothetical protein [Cyanosarcina radialis HA8281-LM2]
MFLKPTTLVTGTILSVVFCGLATSSAMARPSSDANRHGVLVSQDTVDPTDAPSNNSQAATPPKMRIVGVVKSYNNNTLELRDVSGASQPYTVDPSAVGSLNLRPGTMVAVDANQEGQVQSVEMAEVDRTYTGVVREINQENVTLELPDGQTTTTVISPETRSRMGITTGTPLNLTTFRDTTATKVCIGQRPAPVVEAPPALPSGGVEQPLPEPPPVLPPTPSALW